MAGDQRSRAEHDRILEPHHRVVKGKLDFRFPSYAPITCVSTAPRSLAILPAMGTPRWY